MIEFHKRDGGLFVPKAKATGIYTIEHFRKGEKIDEFQAENVCTLEGLIFLLNIGFTSTQSAQNWHVGLFVNNYTPVGSDTAASFGGNAGECVAYSGGARPGFTPAAAAQPTASLNNSASKAVFAFTGSATIMGTFLVSSATPGGTGGILYSAAQFPSSKGVSNTDTMAVGYAANLGST